MRRICIFGIASVLAAAGCSKGEDNKDTPAPTAPAQPTEPSKAEGEVDPAAIAEAIGVEPGPVAVEDGVGADAVATGKGTLELRRNGAEAFAAAEGEIKLFAGDQLRTGDDGSAQVVLVDETVVEMAAGTAIAMGDREAGADPASSVAVLAGVARFNVAARGPGEGAFLVYTPGAVVGTVGTTFGVGVAVTGEARVGVEEGEVEVAGLADLTKPVSVKGEQAIMVPVDGTVAAPVAFADDDWGTWIDESEADAEPAAVVRDHRARIEWLTPQIQASYEAIGQLETELDTAETEAAEYEKANNTAGYREVAPRWGATVEAEFLASQRLQHLTYAALAHAYLANAVYVRHPKKVEVEWKPAQAEIAGAVLWNKRYHSTVHQHVAPRRGFYYRHHPQGRVHAAELQIERPAFYRPKLAPLVEADVRADTKVVVYRPPVIRKRVKTKRVVVAAPPVGWRAGVKVHVRDHRSKAGWYVRPAAPKATIMTGVKVTAPSVHVFSERPPVARGAVKVRWGPRGGVRVKAGGGADTHVKVGPRGGVGVRVQGSDKVKVKVGPRGGGIGVNGKVDEKVDSVRGGVHVKATRPGPKPGPGVGVKVKGGAGVGVKVKAPGGGVKVKAGAGVKVKAPGVKVKVPAVRPPKVKAKGGVKVKAGAGIKVKTK